MTRENRDRLADAVRRLIDHAVNSDVPENEVADIIATLEGLDEQLKKHPRSATLKTKLPDFNDLQAIFRNDPIIGTHNPIAPPVMVEKDGDRIRGTATLGSAYEGPPGYVHGAVLAGVFDMLLGLANVASGNPGMTGTLTVKYRRPTPLNTELRFEAFTHRIDGRKVIAHGTVHAGEDLTAEAEGVFVQLKIDRAVEYFQDREPKRA
ncbi:MAG: PaaI family thioesterase [Actinomycetota bacterium]